MKIGVMSDSHDNLPRIRTGVELLADKGADILLHAGDFIAPFAVKAILTFPGRVLGVFGNNDGEREGILQLWGEVEDGPRKLRLDGCDILMTHDADTADPAREGVDVCIYGHNHEARIQRYNDVLYLNPGECGGWLTGRSTVALLDTEGLDARLLDIHE